MASSLITPLSDRLYRRFPRVQHYVALTRFNRPIGTLLLLWPTLVGLWFAADGWPGWHLFLVFTLGTLLTRSAGCILNDLTDQRFDGHVRRTEMRPLVTGKVTRLEALLLAGAILLLAFILVLTTNLDTVLLAIGAVIVTATYPFMKRFTYLPQAILGIAFSWGILMAYTATGKEISIITWLLVISNLLWVVAYDTQYAMVDRDDDLRIGIKSTAILFGDLDRLMIGVLQGSCVITLLLIERHMALSIWFYGGMVGMTSLFIYQLYLIWQRRREDCFDAFLNNHWVGLALFTGVVLHFRFT